MKKIKILVADDDRNIIAIINRFLSRFGYELHITTDGKEVLNMVRNEMPDLILLDVLMPGRNGYEILSSLKDCINTTLIPVIMISGKGCVGDRINGINSGADDFLAKPFDLWELKTRIDGALHRKSQFLSMNPLTQLPGNISIEKETKKRINSGDRFSLLYLDIDNFKVYNDVYGYIRGDEIIKITSEICVNTVSKYGGQNDFVGHIGGDDFVVITEITKETVICTEIVKIFDRTIPYRYSENDRRKGIIISQDRKGNILEFPIMTLSIGVADNEIRKVNHYAEIVEAATEMKRYVKSIKNRKKSVFMKDRRNPGVRNIKVCI